VESPFRASDLSPDLRVIETLRWQDGSARRIDRHLSRAAATCAALGIAFDRAAATALLAGVTGPGPWRLRLTVDPAGALELTRAPLLTAPALWRVALAGERLDPDDIWLRHKTSRRATYDAARAALPDGTDELVFANRRGELCEGTITNLFFDAGDGLCTPPLGCGLLPGVLRAELLDRGECREEILPIDRLGAVRLWVGNSLRGLIPARLVG
jgi:4-amino-4-deoxychorismate lyase